jgi:hypothetical protein
VELPSRTRIEVVAEEPRCTERKAGGTRESGRAESGKESVNGTASTSNTTSVFPAGAEAEAERAKLTAPEMVETEEEFVNESPAGAESTETVRPTSGAPDPSFNKRVQVPEAAWVKENGSEVSEPGTDATVKASENVADPEEAVSVYEPAGAARSASNETVQEPETSVKQPLGFVRRPGEKPEVAVRNDMAALDIELFNTSRTETMTLADAPCSTSGATNEIVAAFWVTVTGIETERPVAVSRSTVYEPGTMADALSVNDTTPKASEVATAGAVRPEGAVIETSSKSAGAESVPVKVTETVVEEA